MTAPWETPTAKIRRLQPLRVLVAGHDRRFVRVTTFLLARRAYDVAEAEVGDAVAEAQLFRADVVLFEGGSSRSASARVVAQLESLRNPPAVILVTSDGRELWERQRTLAKWSPIDDIVAEVEAAALVRPFVDAAAG